MCVHVHVRMRVCVCVRQFLLVPALLVCFAWDSKRLSRGLCFFFPGSNKHQLKLCWSACIDFFIACLDGGATNAAQYCASIATGLFYFRVLLMFGCE